MSDILGLVLAGGKSRRMGKNKASFVLPNGNTWLAHSFALLSGLTDQVLVAGKGLEGMPTVADAQGPEGPLRAIVGGLEYAIAMKMASLFVLPCDIPNMTMEPLANLLGVHQSHPLPFTCYQNSETGRFEMLIGIYDVSLLPDLKAGLSGNPASLFRSVPPDARFYIPIKESWKTFFHNFNSPGDLVELLNK